MKWCGAKGRADCGKKRSALHRPPQCAASVCAARCICHRTAVHIPVQCRTSGMGVTVKMKWGVLLAPQGRGFSPVQPCSGIQDSLLLIKAKHSSCPHVTHPQMWRCTVGNPGIGISDEPDFISLYFPLALLTTTTPVEPERLCIYRADILGSPWQ